MKIVSSKHSCSSFESIKYKFPYKTFNHTKLEKVQNPNNNLYQCKKCSLIFRNDKDLKYKLDKLFFTSKYTSTRFSKHIDSKSISGKNISHYEGIAKIIKKKFKKQPKKILEIGCYDGSLINVLSKKYKNTEFYGYDVSLSIKKLFKKNCKFKFIDNLDKLNEKFDLIICVNTFQYVPDNQKLIKNMKKIIETNGKIFFLSNFLDNNPYLINYGDQYSYFTKKNILNFFRLNGFDGNVISKIKEFPRNLIGIFKLSKKKTRLLKTKKISFFLNYLMNVEKSLSKISSREVNIFGSTINAKFIFEILNKKIDKINFVDENPMKVNKKLFGAKIIHPSKLKEKSLLIMPYGPTNNQIISKLNKKYEFKYLKL